MRAAAVFRVDAIVGCPLTPPRETGLGVNQSCGDMRAAAVFRVDAIVMVSTPLQRGRQDLVVHQLALPFLHRIKPTKRERKRNSSK
ncbi:hypothetical protein GQ457_17G005930 [Hibiscus cannabinus]